MKPVIIIAIPFVLLIPISVYAEELFPYDSNKGTEHYLDRYYDEPEYKTWFDKNYPDITIEEAIGLVKPFSQIKEQFNECEIDAQVRFNQAVTDYMTTTSSGIGAEINLANKGITLDNYLMICDDQNLVPLNEMALYLMEREEYDYALYYLDNALELFPQYGVVLMNKGMAHFALQEYQEAKTSFEKVLENQPDLELAQEGVERTTRILEGEMISQPVCGKGTVERNGQCVPDYPDTEPSSKGGGCLIATATYGSELAPQVQQLRELRDNSLLNTESGASFMEAFNDFYYSFSPIIADYERENPVFQEMVRIAITPMISSLSVLNYVDMDSEVEVLGYGISLIVLNIGIYFVFPVVMFYKVRRYI